MASFTTEVKDMSVRDEDEPAQKRHCAPGEEKEKEGAAEEDAIKAPEKIKPSYAPGEEKETEGAAEEDAIKAPEEVACVGGAEATITASDDEWELQGSCHNYAGACVGGGEAPEIETIWGKHGTRIWCQYRGEWYHQVLGEGLPNQWVVYIPRRIEGDA